MSDIVKRLKDRAKVAREESTGTALGDALHFEDAAAEIEDLRMTVSGLNKDWNALLKPLEEIARQKLSAEIEAEEPDREANPDYEFGYDEVVRIARAAVGQPSTSGASSQPSESAGSRTGGGE